MSRPLTDEDREELRKKLLEDAKHHPGLKIPEDILKKLPPSTPLFKSCPRCGGGMSWEPIRGVRMDPPPLAHRWECVRCGETSSS